MLDAAGNIKIIFDAGTSVAAGGLLLFERGVGAVPGVAADKIYAGALPNAGGVLAIVDASCGASDILDASLGWPAGNNGTKQTLERDMDGSGWHTSVAPGGTPKAENSVVVVNVATSTVASAATGATATNTGAVTTSTPVVIVTIATSTTAAGGGTAATAPASGTTVNDVTAAASSTVATGTPVTSAQLNYLVIAEVQIAGASSTNDFVKIFNPTAGAVDVSGWKLRKKSNTGADYSLRVLPDGGSIAAGGYFVWANTENGFGDFINANVTSTATLAADNSAALFDAQGTIVDAVAWGEGTNQYVEGAAYPTNPQANQVLKRKWQDGQIVDTNDNANDFTL